MTRKRIVFLLVVIMFVITLTGCRADFDEPLDEQLLVQGVASEQEVPQLTASGTVGDGGAPWRLYSDGTLVVDAGFIERPDIEPDPWYEHRQAVRRITVTGPITAGESLRRLFAWLPNLTTIEGLHYFDTSNVQNMAAVFFDLPRLTSLDLSSWDVGNVTTMSSMFAHTSGLTYLNTTGWDTGNVTNMNWMFARTAIPHIDLSAWDTSSVTNMGHMFYNITARSLDLTGWDTGNVTNMGEMFQSARNLVHLDLSHFDTSRLQNMSNTFARTSGLECLDLSGWDTSNVTNMRELFNGAFSLRQLTLGGQFRFIFTHQQWNDPTLPAVSRNADYTGHWQNVGTGTITDPRGVHVFTSNELLQQFNGATMADTWVWQPGEADDTGFASGTVGNNGAPWRLRNDGTLVVDEGFIHWTGGLGGGLSPWREWRDNIYRIVFTGPITAGTSLQSLFLGLTNVTTIEGLHHFDTSNVTSMRQMFRTATSLINLDLSSWDTGNVRDMSFMFSHTSNLASLDVSGWDTSSLTNARDMFWDARSLTSLNVSGWDTGNLEIMQNMFARANRLRDIDPSAWDTSSATDMRTIFWGTAITSLDLSAWDTSSARNMNSMFLEARSLVSLNLSGWDTSKVTDMGGMFSSMSSLRYLDLSGWDTNSATIMGNMFRISHNLRQITLGEDFGFVITQQGTTANLPQVPNNDTYTGYWQNAGSGTVDNPQGEFVLTSAQLMADFHGPTMADTWVWQPRMSPHGEILIIFDAAGGIPEQQMILADQQADDTFVLRSQPESVARGSFIFDGWFNEDDVELRHAQPFTYYCPRVFTARWRFHGGTLLPMAFDANGGLPALQPTMAEVGEGVTFGTLVTDPRVVRPVHPDNRPFLGWARTAGATEAEVIPANEPWTEATAQAEVFAVWGRIFGTTPFPMVFDANGGFPVLQPTIARVGDGVTFGALETDPSIVQPVHPNGYRFLGWSTSLDEADLIADNAPWTADTAETIVFAIWEEPPLPPLFPMTFNANGGVPALQPVVAIIHQHSTFGILHTDPWVRTPVHPSGYRFLGWARTADATAADLISANEPWTEATAQAEVFAVWQPPTSPHGEILIIFDGAGGIPEQQMILADQQADDTFVLRSQPELVARGSFIFDGWFNEDGVELRYAQPFTYDCPRVFTARWRFHGGPLPMAFDANGGAPALQPVMAQVGEGVTFGNLQTSPWVVTPRHPDGHRFLGWARTANATAADVIPANTPWTEATAQAMVFAVWEGPWPISITFRGNGGAPDSHVVTIWMPSGMDCTTFIPFDAFQLHPTAIHPIHPNGYDFLGWSRTEDGGTGIITGNTFLAMLNTSTVWAQWDETITLSTPIPMLFDANGGAPALQPVMAQVGEGVTFGSLQTIPWVMTPQHPNGYRFLGWARTANATVADMIPANEPWTETTASSVVFAVWEDTYWPISITFRGNGGAPDSHVVTILIPPGIGCTTFIPFDAFQLHPTAIHPIHPNGYDFLGWSRTEDGGTGIITGNTFLAMLNTSTVWAQWDETITLPTPIPMLFDANGGAPALQPAMVYVGDDVTFGSLEANPRIVQPLHPNDSYNFRGWARTAEATAAEVIPANEPWTKATAQTVVFAVWERAIVTPPHVFRANFRGNGGAPDNQETVVFLGPHSTFGALETDQVIHQPMHPSGYVFLGWSASEDGSMGIIADNTEWNWFSPRTVYAQWDRPGGPSYPISIAFDANGGTPAAQMRDVTFGEPYGALFRQIVMPTRVQGSGIWATTMQFIGWFTTPNGSGVQIHATDIVTADSPRVLYARWRGGASPAIMLSFDGDGGIPERQGVNFAQVANATFAEALAMIDEPVKAGHRFIGWASVTWSGGEQILRPVLPTDPAPMGGTFTAQWEATTTPAQTVTFNANNGFWPGLTGGAGWADQQRTILLNGTYSQAFNAAGQLQPDMLGAPTQDVPARPGYIFDGWETTAGVLVSHTDVVTNEDARTLRARWTWDITQRQTVTFDANGGTWLTGTSPPVTREVIRGTGLTYGQILMMNNNDLLNPALDAPIRLGHIFGGWFDTQANANSFGTMGNIRSTMSVTSEAARTLYARWIRNPNWFPVGFNANGGTWPEGTTLPVTRDVMSGGSYGQMINAQDNLIDPNLNHPERPGYTFGGWFSSEATANGTTQSGRVTHMTPAGPIHHSLWARWVEDPHQRHTVSFDPNGGLWPGLTGPEETENQTRIAVRPGDYSQVITATHIRNTPLIPSLPANEQAIPIRYGYQFMGWATTAGAVTPNIVSTTQIPNNAGSTIFAVWERTGNWFTIGFQFEGLDTPLTVLPNQPIDWDQSPEAREIYDTGHEHATGTWWDITDGHGNPGRAFWGWFRSDELVYDRGLPENRPALGSTGEDLSTLTFTESELEEGITLTAVWSLWGDVNDDGRVNWRDVLLLTQWEHDRLLESFDDPVRFNPQLNLHAADVNVDGVIDGRDVLALNQWLHDQDLIHWGLMPRFEVVLGRPAS